MTIHKDGKEIIAKKYGYSNWDFLFETEYRTGKLKDYVIEASQESRRILYDDFKERYPLVEDEVFDYFSNYIFVQQIKP